MGPSFELNELSIGVAIFIFIAALVHFTQFNKVKWPAWLALIFNMSFLILFFLGALIGSPKDYLNFD